MANIPPEFLSPEQLTAFREILDARRFQAKAVADAKDWGIYSDYLATNPDDILAFNAPQIEKYNRIVIPPYGDVITPLGVKGDEAGAARAMIRYMDFPRADRILGIEGDLIDPKKPSIEELAAHSEIGDRTFARAGSYIASSNPESIDLGVLRSYAYGTPEENLLKFAKDPANLVSRDWWLQRPLIPSDYDPRSWERRVLQQEPRMRHYEALDRKIRGVATEADLENIWDTPYGHPDLLHEQPTTPEDALRMYEIEKLHRDAYLGEAGARRAQFNRQLAVQLRKLQDPQFAEKLDSTQQAFRDARKYLTWTSPSEHTPQVMFYPDTKEMGHYGPKYLDEEADHIWNFMKQGNRAGVLPAIEAMVDYNKFIKGSNLTEGLLGVGETGSSYDFNIPRTKGGYLGSNFAPQLEALYDRAREQDRLLRLANRRLTDRYLIDPKFRSAVNRFIPNTLRTPTAGAVGGLLSMAGQAIDATDPDYMNRNYRGTDPLSIRPLYDLLLAPVSGQSYSDAGRAYEKMVADPEYIQRNPISSMVGQAVRGDPQYLKAFFNAYNPFK